MNKYLLSSILSLASLNALAQDLKVEGRIVNTDNQPLAGVTVRLYNDTTMILRTVSNNKGDFTTQLANQSQSKFDNLTIAISCLGYESQVFSLQDIYSSANLGTIQLNAATKDMGEAVVTSERIKHSSEKIVKIPSKVERAHSSDAITLLNQMSIADLKVDIINSKVSANGKDLPIYINFMPASANDIASLHPDEIVRVEYNVHPKGEFQNEGPVINFIVRQRDHGGLLMGKITQQEELAGDYTLSYKLFHKKNQFTIAYNGKYSRAKDYQTTINQFYNPTEDAYTTRREYAEDGTLNKSRSHAAIFDYKYAGKTFFSDLGFTFVVPKSPEVTNTLLRTQDSSTDLTKVTTTTLSQSKAPTLTWNMRKILNKRQIFSLNTTLQYSHNNYANYMENKEGDATTYSWDNTAKEDYYELESTLKYNKVIGNSSSFAVLGYLHHMWTLTDYLGNNKAHSWLHYGGENLMASYVWSITKALNLTLGAGMTHYQKYNKNWNEKKDEWFFTPAIELRYDLKKANITLGTSTGCGSDAELSQNTNVEQDIDDLQAKVGKSNLTTTRYINSFANGNVQIPKGYLYWGAYYRGALNNCFNETRYDAAHNKYIHSLNADGNRHEFTLRLQYVSNFSQKIRFSLGGLWNYTKEVADRGSSNTSRSLSHPYGFASAEYFAGPFSFMVYGNSTFRELAQGYKYERANLGAQISFTQPRYAFTLTCANITCADRRHQWMSTGELYRKSTYGYSEIGKRRAFVTLQFTFNLQHGNKKHQYEDVDINTKVGSGIVK